MQVKRLELDELDDLIKFFKSTAEDKTTFDPPEKLDIAKMLKLLEDKSVKEVHVFKGTPTNTRMAQLRHEHPEKTRKQLRKMIKGK